MLWSILLTLFFSLLVYILVAPISLELNTYSKSYVLKVIGLLHIEIKSSSTRIFYFTWKTPILKGNIYPLDKVRPLENNSHKRKKLKNRIVPRLALLRHLFNEIKVRDFSIDIDTGSYLQNAKLYAIIPILRSWGFPLKINFIGQTNFKLSIYSRPIYFLKGFINYKTSNYGITF